MNDMHDLHQDTANRLFGYLTTNLDRHIRRLWPLCGRRAAEVAERAVTKLGERIAEGKELPPSEALSGYFAKACENAWKDLRCDEKRRPNITSVFGDHGPTEELFHATRLHRMRKRGIDCLDIDDPGVLAEKKDKLRLVLDGLDSLSRGERICVEHTLEQRDPQEIAEREKMSVGTVRVLLDRAVEKLRRLAS